MVMQNKAQVLARLGKIPEKVKAKLAPALETEVEQLVQAQKRAAPVGTSEEGDQHPGLLRDSIHKYPNSSRPLSWRVIADARDDQGNMIGKHVETGHRAKDGSHVPAKPFFYPTYRAWKRPARRRLLATSRQGFRES